MWVLVVWSNALPELVKTVSSVVAVFDLRKVLNDEPGMSPVRNLV